MGDGRLSFSKNIRNNIKETVEKAFRCGTKDMGFARYECLGCEGSGLPKFVYFTCKSRFCHDREKKYIDGWSDKQQELIFIVPHDHMVFTILEELRNLFYDDRKSLNELSNKLSKYFNNIIADEVQAYMIGELGWTSIRQRK